MPSDQGNAHPSKLDRDAIVEAVCELRFEAQSEITGLLPGLLFAQLPGLFSGIERMPGMDLPPILLQMDPNMHFLATQKLKGDGIGVILGDRVVGIVCSPYKGWADFKGLILKVWGVLSQQNFNQKPLRASLKYVNMLDGQNQDLAEATTVRLELGMLAVTNQPCQIRTEFVEGDYTRIITIANPAAAQLQTGEKRQGCVVDVDVLCNAPATDLLHQGEGLLDDLHDRAKSVFFDILSDSELAARGPTYG